MTLVGQTVRVTAAIRNGEEGEVMGALLGGSQAFPARAYDPEEEFQDGERVLVVEVIGRTVYVTAGGS